MGSLVTRDMLLKHTALALAVFAAIADARRLRGGRKRGNRGRGKGKRPAAAAAAVSAEVDEAFFPSLSEPGSEELFASIVSGEFEDFVAEFHEEQLANHPLNSKRKCVRVKKRWVCEYIPNSELPWCPYGWSEANKEQFKGKGKAAAWGHGKKKGGKPKGKGGFRELGEQMSEGSDQFQEMMSEMDQIENQFGHSALDAEIQKFQNKKKKRGKGGKWTRNSYEEDLALSYVDDDVKDRK